MQLLKKKFFNVEFIKFLIVGSINTGAGYIFYLAFIQVMAYTYAYSLSYALSVVVSYVLNARFVFNEPLSLKKLLAFPLVYIVQYITGLCLVYIAVEKLSIPPVLAPLLIIIVTLPVTFLLARLIVK
ncbi:GtrA family protein [Pseudomonas sp. SZMC_28357]|uniref:GtrA family protein n=1 Tax=Pseudomonas sp. SZMC_28357 TaxID=3074380 RepID=UPI002871180C|nr:GtrA family protein [Pseudomonas sp. SZMC_28357]MDR9753892.1 GtrA family protein [Pseudomonas sp. SZMC_28357]